MSELVGIYGREEFTSLLEKENFLDGAFECLRRIWSQPDAFAQRRLDDSEYLTRRLERELSTLYPPLYDDLLSQMGEHPIMDIEAGCGVIMDALSLREGFQLEQDLRQEHDWDVSLSWAAIERVPSETQYICQEWFNRNGPSAVSRDDFRFIGDLNVPQLPGTDVEYVWTRMPDIRLEEALKGNYSTEEVGEIYEDTKALLEGIVNESVHEEFLVTSDHGYVNHLGQSPYTLRSELEDAISNKFSTRHREVANGQAFQLLEEADVIERVGGHYMVRGHYKWTKRGSSKKIMHGGLSLPECLTPVLRINTASTGGD